MLNELTAFWLHTMRWLWQPEATHSLIIIVFLLNFLFGVGIAYLLAYYTLPHLIRPQQRKLYWWFLISVNTFIPLLGWLITCSASFLLRRYTKQAHSVKINILPRINYTKDKAAGVQAFGAGWAMVRLQSAHFAREERTKALIGINQSGFGRDINIINRQLLSDNMDELRLYAFSLLENQQNQVNKFISQFSKALEETHDVVRRAKIEKQLALLYWELVYLRLSDEELRQFVLEKSRNFAESALKVLNQDAILWVLLARIHMEKHDTKQAIEALNTAIKYHGPNSKTYPFFAEFSFKQRDYVQVKKYLSMDISFNNIPKLSHIVEYWCAP